MSDFSDLEDDVGYLTSRVEELEGFDLERALSGGESSVMCALEDRIDELERFDLDYALNHESRVADEIRAQLAALREAVNELRQAAGLDLMDDPDPSRPTRR